MKLITKHISSLSDTLYLIVLTPKMLFKKTLQVKCSNETKKCTQIVESDINFIAVLNWDTAYRQSTITDKGKLNPENPECEVGGFHCVTQTIRCVQWPVRCCITLISRRLKNMLMWDDAERLIVFSRTSQQEFSSKWLLSSLTCSLATR